MAGANISQKIQVIVSDNASTDHTQIVLQNFKAKNFILSYHSQEINVGFDGNIRFLYELVETDYVWFFSDDDIILPGASKLIVDTLKNTAPEVMLFSFTQPKDSLTRNFNYLDEYVVVKDPKEIIAIFTKCSKLSAYICKKISLTDSEKIELLPFYENGFFWIDLCFSIVAATKEPRLCIISRPLASCDDDFNHIRFDPRVFLESYKVLEHPFVKKFCPDMAKRYRATSYIDAIQLMFAVEMGSIKPENIKVFKREIAVISIHLSWLIVNPRSLFQLLLLKLHLVGAYRFYKNLMSLSISK